MNEKPSIKEGYDEGARLAAGLTPEEVENLYLQLLEDADANDSQLDALGWYIEKLPDNDLERASQLYLHLAQHEAPSARELSAVSFDNLVIAQQHEDSPAEAQRTVMATWLKLLFDQDYLVRDAAHLALDRSVESLSMPNLWRLVYALNDNARQLLSQRDAFDSTVSQRDTRGPFMPMIDL